MAIETLPADLTNPADLPEVYATAREGFGFEWFEMTVDGTRGVAVYRFTLGGTFTWSECLPVRGGETLASVVARAKDLHRNAA